MTVIADTSAVYYAVLIDAGEAILRLYGRLTVPLAVYAEMTAPGAPQILRDWLGQNVSRIDVWPVTVEEDLRLHLLDPGEREAIALAEQRPESLLIVDDRQARNEARRRGIAITGLLGVIRDAALRGMLDFETALQKLRATDFRLSPQVESMARDQFRRLRNAATAE